MSRCCGKARETLQHLTECEVCGVVFEDFRRLTDFPPTATSLEKYRHALFAERPDGTIEDEGWINIHLLMWKRVISLLVQVDTENATFDPREVWRSTKWRFESKAKALNEKIQMAQRRADTRGTNPPNLDRRSEPLEPVAGFGSEGLFWNEEIQKQLAALSANDPPPNP